jgi:hypothetical protein
MNKIDIESKWKEIETKLSESTKELYGSKGFSASSAPLHKSAKVEIGKDGVTAAPSEFKASKKMETSPDNKNKEGASEVHHSGKGFEGKKGAVGVDGVERKEGATGGADISKKSYGAKAFREKVYGVLGLPINDKLNKPNAGKNTLSESTKLKELDVSNTDDGDDKLEKTQKMTDAGKSRRAADNKEIEKSEKKVNKKDLIPQKENIEQQLARKDSAIAALMALRDETTDSEEEQDYNDAIKDIQKVKSRLFSEYQSILSAIEDQKLISNLVKGSSKQQEDPIEEPVVGEEPAIGGTEDGSELEIKN